MKKLKEANALRNAYTHSEYMPMLGPGDELIKVVHQSLKSHGKSIGPGESFEDLIKNVDEHKLNLFPQELSNLDHDVRVLAEKFIDSLPA